MTSLDQAHLQVSARSHPGETGKNNEDRYAVIPQRLGSRRIPAVLAIVADGIGGHQAGEVASQLTVDTVARLLQSSAGRAPPAELRAAVIEAARAIGRASQEAEERRGMGSTVAIVWVIGERLFTAFVGDSRIHLMRRGVLRQTSIDHSWIQEALEHHVITPEEAKQHPNAHVLRRHLGGEQIPEPDLRLRLSPSEGESRARSHQGLGLLGGDQILLSTDGLTDLVSEDEIRHSLLSNPPDQAVDSLIDLARSRGGHDNITLVLLSMPAVSASEIRGRRVRFLRATVSAAVALVALVSLAVAAAWWFGFWPWAGP